MNTISEITQEDKDNKLKLILDKYGFLTGSESYKKYKNIIYDIFINNNVNQVEDKVVFRYIGLYFPHTYFRWGPSF